MINKYQNCPEILREFLLYMETIRNLSPRTVDGYFIDLRLFLRWLKMRRGLCASDLTLEQIDEIDIMDVDLALVKSVTTMDIYEYLHFVMRGRENNANSRARKVSSLRSYYKYLTVKAHKIEKDPVKDVEVPSIRRTLPKFLNLNESMSLLGAVESAYPARDYCILTLFLNCGMRLSELVGIDLNDISGDTVKIIGKGNKERIIYLNDACLAAIANCRTERDGLICPKKDPAALFLSRTGSRLTARRVEQIVERCLARAGLDNRGFSPHKLRHTAATLMYRHGNVDMLALKEILGHEHVSTTEIYTHIGDDQLKAAAKASPLSSVRPPRKQPAASKNIDQRDKEDQGNE